MELPKALSKLSTGQIGTIADRTTEGRKRKLKYLSLISKVIKTVSHWKEYQHHFRRRVRQ